jgi:hypothetical protein
MATAGSSEMGLHSIPAELLHSILASRDSLRCRDLGRLASTCRLFTTAHAIDHIDAAAEAVVAHWSPAAQARLQRHYRPAGSQYRPGQICWLQTLGKLETLEGRMRGWTGSCVAGPDVWEHRMCAFDAWVKEAETVPALTETLNDVVDVDVAWTYIRTNVRVRSLQTNIELMEVMVGYTVLEAESALKDFEEELEDFQLGELGADYSAAAFGFLVRFLRASLCRKEHSMLLPWIEKLDSYGREVHKLHTPHSKPGWR